MNKPVAQASIGRFAVENLQPVFARKVVRHQGDRVSSRSDRDEGDAAYYARRAGEERAVAMASCHPLARLLHLELAQRYALRAAAIGEADQQLGAFPDAVLSERT